MSGEQETGLTVAGQFNPQVPVKFEVNMTELQQLKVQYGELKIRDLSDTEGHAKVVAARKVCVKHRTAVERQRKEFKAAALEYGRNVDATAKSIISVIEEVEAHLVAEETAWKEAHEKIKREQELARQRALQERLDKLAAVNATANPLVLQTLSEEEFADLLAMKTEQHEAEQERKRREELAEQQRLAEEEARRKAEAERLAEERKALEAERAKIEADRKRAEAEALESLRKEQEQLAAERKALEEERRRVDEEESRRRTEEKEALNAQLAALEEERKAVEAERLRIEEDKRAAERKVEDERRAEREKQEAEARRQREEAERPDRVKLASVADAVAQIEVPEVAESLQPVAASIRQLLTKTAATIGAIAREGA